MAFERAGGRCVFSSEWDKDCQKTYQANYNEVPHGDITKIAAEEIPDFDVLVAGFPCQPFSSIGKRQGFKHKTQGTLFYDVARIIDAKKPKAFLLENVPGLLTHAGGNTYRVIEESLFELGYVVHKEVLDSKDFGVPQRRKRIYIVGIKKGLAEKFKFPRNNGRVAYINKFIEEGVEGYEISERLQKNYIFKVDDGRPELVDRNTKIQVKTLVASYHKIQRLTGTFVKDGITGLRLFTPNECKAIMGFPNDFIVPVSRTQMYRQFGNSVAVPVVESIANALVKYIPELNHARNNTTRRAVSSKRNNQPVSSFA